MTDMASVERKRENWRRYYYKNLDANRAKARASAARCRERDPCKQLERSRRWRGIPDPARPALAACECCGGPPGENRKTLCLDHDHETGAFRGWLCGTCNKGIGNLGDNLQGVLRAAAYLKRG